MRRLVLWMAFAALVLGGCSEAPTRALAWTELTYHMTGGIAGFNRQVTLAPEGAFTVTERGKSPVKGKLTSADLNRLKESVAAIAWSELQPKYIDPQVADAIFETVTVATADKSYTTQVGTGGTPPPQLADLLSILKQVGK